MTISGGQLEFDDTLANRIEALARTGDMVRRRHLVHRTLAPAAGERILDVGCGPGLYLPALRDAVGPEGTVVGVDASPQMAEAAARRCAGRDGVTILEGDATALPVPDASVDAALSVQVMEYVQDVPAALAELRRVVRVGGRVLIWDVDWATVSWHSSDPGRMHRVLGAWDEHLTHPSLPRTLAGELRAAGYDGVSVVGHAFATADFSADAYGCAILPLIEEYVPGHGGVTSDEAAAWAAEQRDLGDRGAFSFACIQSCFTARRAG
jgi:SAM-dependent methyltransferase